MSNLSTLIDQLESKWLKHRLANIVASQSLMEEQKIKKIQRSIRSWIAGIAIIRILLSIITLATIIPLYNLWAKRKGLQSRWFKEPSLTPVKDELAKVTPVSTPTGSPRNPSSEQTEDDQSSASHTDADPTEEANEPKHTEEANEPKQTEETNQQTDHTSVSGETEEPESESENDETEELDKKKFDQFYEPDTLQTIMNNAANRPQLLRLLFNDVDPNDAQKVSVFVNQLLTVIKMSKKYDSPAIFVAKEPIDANHFICGLFWENTLLFIDLNGVHDDKNYERIKKEYHEQLAKDDMLKNIPELKSDQAFLRANRKIQNDRDIPNRSEETGAVSCGPITAEFVKTVLTAYDRNELLTWLNYMKTEVTPSNLLDISLIMPPHLESLVCPSDNKGTHSKELYMRKVLQIRYKHDSVLQSSQINSTPEQELFMSLLFGGSLDEVAAHIDSALKGRNYHLTQKDPPPVSPTLARYRKKAMSQQQGQPNTGPTDNKKHDDPETRSPRK